MAIKIHPMVDDGVKKGTPGFAGTGTFVAVRMCGTVLRACGCPLDRSHKNARWLGPPGETLHPRILRGK